VDISRKKDDRVRLYKLLEVGRRELRMSDEAFRQLLARHGAKERDGHPSRKTMSLSQLAATVDEMCVKGFRPRPKGGARVSDWRAARVAKLRAMWIALADAGVVRDRSDKALIMFCARITGIARIEWLPSRKLSDCVTALRTWARREGVLKE